MFGPAHVCIFAYLHNLASVHHVHVCICCMITRASGVGKGDDDEDLPCERRRREWASWRCVSPAVFHDDVQMLEPLFCDNAIIVSAALNVTARPWRDEKKHADCFALRFCVCSALRYSLVWYLGGLQILTPEQLDEHGIKSIVNTIGEMPREYKPGPQNKISRAFAVLFLVHGSFSSCSFCRECIWESSCTCWCTAMC